MTPAAEVAQRRSFCARPHRTERRTAAVRRAIITSASAYRRALSDINGRECRHEGFMVTTMNPMSWCFVGPSSPCPCGRREPTRLHRLQRHEPLMVGTMNPLSWCFVRPRIHHGAELVFCPATTISRVFFGHEGFHEAFHEGPSSSWQPWTPPRSNGSDPNGRPLGLLPHRGPPVIAWPRVSLWSPALRWATLPS